MVNEKLTKDNLRLFRGKVTDHLEVAFQGTYESFMCRCTDEGLMVSIKRREKTLLNLLIPLGVLCDDFADSLVFEGETSASFSRNGVSIWNGDYGKFNMFIQREDKCMSSWYKPAK